MRATERMESAVELCGNTTTRTAREVVHYARFTPQSIPAMRVRPCRPPYEIWRGHLRDQVDLAEVRIPSTRDEIPATTSV